MRWKIIDMRTRERIGTVQAYSRTEALEKAQQQVGDRAIVNVLPLERPSTVVGSGLCPFDPHDPNEYYHVAQRFNGKPLEVTPLAVEEGTMAVYICARCGLLYVEKTGEFTEEEENESEERSSEP